MDSGISTKRKRKHDNSDFAVLDELEWTATRCFRLLRSIESRTAVLRRIAKSTGGSARHAKTNEKPLPTKTNTTAQHDPAWLQGSKEKPSTTARTYSSREQSRKSSRPAVSKPSTGAGSFKFSSPLLKRLRPDASEQISGCWESTKSNQRPNRAPQGFQGRYSKRTTEVDEAERQLEMALANVLMTTRAINRARKRGVSTLKKLCLRRIHLYIELDNEITNAESPNTNNDCTFEIYTSLEGRYSSKDTGWGGLREVVRAHSIGTICKAIEDMLLSSPTIERLIEMCSEQDAVEEGQEIIRTWLPETRRPGGRQLEILEAFSKKHECYGFLLRTWLEIGSRDQSFPYAQIRKPGFADLMLKGFMEVPGSEASEWLHDCIATSMRSGFTNNPKLKPSNLYMEKAMTRITVIAAIHTTLSDERNRVEPLVEHVFRALISLYQQRLDNTATEYLKLPKYLVMAVLVLMSLRAGSLPGSLTILLRDITHKAYTEAPKCTDSNSVDDNEVTFARNFAEAILHLESRLGIDLIKKMINRLSGTEAFAEIGRKLLRKTKLELAIAASRSDFSEQDDPVLMEEVSKILAFRTGEALMKTPDFKIAPRGLRWEESICEWTLMTPANDVTADDGPIGGKAEGEANKENEDSDLHHAARNDDPGPPPSSPDVLVCSPSFKHTTGCREDGSADRWTKGYRPLRYIRTPTRKGPRKSLLEFGPGDSPDVIAMRNGAVERRLNVNAVQADIPLGLSSRLLGSREVVERSPYSKRRSTSTLLMTRDDDEDELG